MARNSKGNSQPNRNAASKLTRKEILLLLLEEYKNCTQVLMNENRIAWVRFNVFLSISSALIAVWVGFTNSGLLTEFGQLLTGLIGFLVAVAWLFVTWKAHAYNDLWAARLEEIENNEALGGILKTFNDNREERFYDNRPLWQKKPTLDNLRSFVPYMFSCFWLILVVNVRLPMPLEVVLVKALLLIFIPPIVAASWAARHEKKSKATKRKPKSSS